MTKKSYPERVKWTIEADASFNAVKRALINEPILMAPNFNQPFVLQTDASQHGIAGILCQYDDNGLLHPVMYASRKLSSAESRYSLIERELLAIVWSLQHYSHIVFGQEITVQTDHQPLQYLDSLSEKNSRLTRWSLILQNFRLCWIQERLSQWKRWSYIKNGLWSVGKFVYIIFWISLFHSARMLSFLTLFVQGHRMTFKKKTESTKNFENTKLEYYDLVSSKDNECFYWMLTIIA